MSKDIAEKMLLHMLCRGYLEEEPVDTMSGFTAYYLKLGGKVSRLEDR